MNVLKRLWADQAGFVVSAELVLVATVMVIGLLVGLTTVRNSVTNELADVAAAVDEMNQTYEIGTITGHGSAVAGFGYTDTTDFCDVKAPTAGETEQCILINNGDVAITLPGSGE